MKLMAVAEHKCFFKKKMEILFPDLRVLRVRRRNREKERRKNDYRSFVERRKGEN